MTTRSVPRLADIDLSRRIETVKAYERRLVDLQMRLLSLQQRYAAEGRRAIIAFEGWDAAGKGGTIRRLSERLDPRRLHVHSIAAPSAEEQGRHYLYRFWERLPVPGDIAVFDRSWYGRVLVERIEGFTPPEAWGRAYEEINRFEKMLTDDGVRLVKLFLHLSDAEQLKRFAERLDNPYKSWKLTGEDLRNRSKRAAYEAAIDEMFEKTHTENAPWHAISAEYKLNGRLECLEAIAATLGAGVSAEPLPPDPKVAKALRKLLKQRPD